MSAPGNARERFDAALRCGFANGFSSYLLSACEELADYPDAAMPADICRLLDLQRGSTYTKGVDKIRLAAAAEEATS